MCPAALDESIDFTPVRALVRKHAALVLDESKSALIVSRLRPLAMKEGFSSLSALVSAVRLGRSPDLQRKVVEALLTHETSFFRDNRPFLTLKDHIIPALIQKNRRFRSLTIWSAACSSGQEPYTLSMMLRESFPELSTWNVTVLATDYSTEILEKAKEGSYSHFEANRGLPAAYLVKYFQRDGTRWTVKDEIKKMVTFKHMNLTKPFPALPKADLVLIRNVLIYFDQPTKESVLTRIGATMSKDGYLALGASESMVFLNTPFDQEVVGGTYWYRPR